MSVDDPERFRELLAASHTFPGPYLLSVITINEAGAVDALRGALAERHALLGDDATWTLTESRGGRYVSHRVTVRCESPDDVLALYATVRVLRGVMTVL